MSYCDICRTNVECNCTYIKQYQMHLCNKCAQWYLAFKKLDLLLNFFRDLLSRKLNLKIAKNIRLMESDKFWLNNKL